MILFPAVDIKDGQCVRLKQGKADAVTVFSKDPVAAGRHWDDLGASWIHVVDLDGAFKGQSQNFEIISTMCKQVPLPIQLGGGIRDAATAKKYLDGGVARIVIGTMALEQPQVLEQLSTDYPNRVGVSLDVHAGRLKTRGWVKDSGQGLVEALSMLEQKGVSFVVYTDISRDGMEAGFDLAGLEKVLDATSLPVIVAGGVCSLQDVKDLHSLGEKGLAGAIVGQAIYSGRLDFAQAVQWLRSQP